VNYRIKELVFVLLMKYRISVYVNTELQSCVCVGMCVCVSLMNYRLGIKCH